MVTARPLALVFALVLGALALVALEPAAARAEVVPAPACLRWWGESWPRTPGYDHLVFIDNACAAPVDCSVRTDIAPDPIQQSVQPGQRIDLTTFRGSPSRGFTARVVCTMNVPRPRKTEE